MRFKFGTYEVEVKAKDYDSARFNKQDTLSFLCALNVELIQARDKETESGYSAWADVTDRSIDNIHAVLEENHYDPIKIRKEK